MSEIRDLPVRPLGASVYVVREGGGERPFLLMRRGLDEPDFPGLWQQVSGGIHEGEAAWQTAVREVREEAGLQVRRLYSGDCVETFYDPGGDCVMMLVVFVAFVAADAAVTLSPEHDRFEWMNLDAARRRVSFRQQKSCLEMVQEDFLDAEPPQVLHIELPEG